MARGTLDRQGARAALSPHPSAPRNHAYDPQRTFMLVSTLVRRGTALLTVLVAANACSDAISAPRAKERPGFDIQALRPEDSRFAWDGPGATNRGSGDRVATFTVDPNVSRSYTFGPHWIYFPAQSICDPATSGYGITLWDVPCARLSHPIEVTVNWSNRSGYTVATFKPQLRFVPAAANSVNHWVILSLHNVKKLHELNLYDILYNGGDGWIDESLTDPTLHAWLDPLHNSVVRRIKHFSGYMVAAANSDMGGFGDASF
jgi:hypothetical protein